MERKLVDVNVLAIDHTYILWQFYTIAVGKLNVAKMANFMEIDIFVLVACPENSLVESQVVCVCVCACVCACVCKECSSCYAGVLQASGDSI